MNSPPKITPLEAPTHLLTHHFSPIQAHSAPARGWDIGRFGRSDSRAVLQYEGSSAVRESGPWSHLQTFALSAPEHDDGSSQDFQIEAVSQWPSSLQDNDMLHPFTISSYQQRQPLAHSARMQENPYSAERNLSQRSRLHNQARSATSLHLPDPGFIGHGMLHTSAQGMAGSSASSSFPRTAASGLPRQSNSAPMVHPRSAYPLQHPIFDEMRRSNTGLRRDFEAEFRSGSRTLR